MKTVIGLFSACILVLLSPHAHAGSTTPARQMENLISLSGVQPNTRRGQQFFTNQQGRDWSCASCHTADPTAVGKDLKTGNVIQPMAPSANPDRVFVVHGRNQAAADSMFAFLRSLGLKPIEWDQAVAMTGKGSPYVGEVLDVAFGPDAVQAQVGKPEAAAENGGKCRREGIVG